MAPIAWHWECVNISKLFIEVILRSSSKMDPMAKVFLCHESHPILNKLNIEVSYWPQDEHDVYHRTVQYYIDLNGYNVEQKFHIKKLLQFVRSEVQSDNMRVNSAQCCNSAASMHACL